MVHRHPNHRLVSIPKRSNSPVVSKIRQKIHRQIYEIGNSSRTYGVSGIIDSNRPNIRSLVHLLKLQTPDTEGVPEPVAIPARVCPAKRGQPLHHLLLKNLQSFRRNGHFFEFPGLWIKNLFLQKIWRKLSESFPVRVADTPADRSFFPCYFTNS